jgi:hypothetical protein
LGAGHVRAASHTIRVDHSPAQSSINTVPIQELLAVNPEQLFSSNGSGHLKPDLISNDFENEDSPDFFLRKCRTNLFGYSSIYWQLTAPWSLHTPIVPSLCFYPSICKSALQSVLRL